MTDWNKNALDYDINYNLDSLGYNLYFSEGDEMVGSEEYTSHNTHRLIATELKKLLLTLSLSE